MARAPPPAKKLAIKAPLQRLATYTPVSYTHLDVYKRQFQGIVSEEQLNALVAYVKSLAQPAPKNAGLQNQPAASPAQLQKTQVQ